mmetsp:Transcript_8183/g.21405  ORF Transcript_8183/g.21405 Transcript_8183/m.21405 type:complete len:346 (+) Transcript_8183:24-1061(+)|eukprot:CAMPEP_0115853122 /NCGR_PEP_ID=MMETSP0287-20121206/13343_1 /TAXON_ID=412157 /ORGANISM="Chrysochromulina rotalis, Strain UIO044" /LENGTH=345 /DNA_ID=CAMNT_0003307193 /DNA_START=24 /DNA_END=1061 /DNA_ORIENTATION=+
MATPLGVCPFSSTVPRHEAVQLLQYRGALVAIGPAIDSIAALFISAVPEHAQSYRNARDGCSYHITLVPKAELSGVRGMFTEQEICQRQSLALAPFVPLGVGTARSSYFVVLLWPAAQAYRTRLGLPLADLHITLGFVKHDTHDIPKSVLQLLAPGAGQPPIPARWRRWNNVINVAQALADGCRARLQGRSTCDRGCSSHDEPEAVSLAISLLCSEAHLAREHEAEATLRCIRGSLLGTLRHLDEALEEAEAACTCGPELPQPYLLVASCLAARGQWGKADAALRTAAELLEVDEDFLLTAVGRVGSAADEGKQDEPEAERVKVLLIRLKKSEEARRRQVCMDTA